MKKNDENDDGKQRKRLRFASDNDAENWRGRMDISTLPAWFQPNDEVRPPCPPLLFLSLSFLSLRLHSNSTSQADAEMASEVKHLVDLLPFSHLPPLNLSTLASLTAKFVFVSHDELGALAFLPGVFRALSLACVLPVFALTLVRPHFEFPLPSRDEKRSPQFQALTRWGLLPG
jgi:hypothetical protein